MPNGALIKVMVSCSKLQDSEQLQLISYPMFEGKNKKSSPTDLLCIPLCMGVLFSPSNPSHIAALGKPLSYTKEQLTCGTHEGENKSDGK
jgi:hypothetical protein